MEITVKDNLSPSPYLCGAAYMTFCHINGQSVNDNAIIEYSNNVIAQETYNLAEIWNEIQDAMKAVHDLGLYGTRHPDISDLTEQQKNDYTTLSYYNNLLNKINQPQVSGIEYIKALDFVQKLQNGIKGFQIDRDRCNVCNNSCQYCDSCQEICQNQCQDQEPCRDWCEYCEGEDPCAVSGDCLSSCQIACEDGGGGVCNNSCCMVGCWSNNCAGYMCAAY